MFLAPAGPCNVSRIAGVGSISWEYSPMSRPRSRVQKPHGNAGGGGEEGRGGWAARRGPRTTSRLQIALFARVSGHAVKVFNGILPLLRSLEASSRESRSVAPLSSVVLISPFFKTVSLLILLKWSKYNVFVIYRIFISSSYILPCPGKFHYFGGILLLVIKKNYYSITLKKNRTRSWTQGK